MFQYYRCPLSLISNLCPQIIFYQKLTFSDSYIFFLHVQCICTRLKKTIRHIAVRETGVSQHHWDPIEKLLRPSQHYRIDGFKGDSMSGPHYTERRQSLRQRMCFFSNLDALNCNSSLGGQINSELITHFTCFRIFFCGMVE